MLNVYELHLGRRERGEVPSDADRAPDAHRHVPLPDPSQDDREMQDVFAAHETRVLAAVTKSDKLPRGRRPARERELREALQLDEDQAIMTSARTGEGVAELREAVAELVRGTAA